MINHEEAVRFTRPARGVAMLTINRAAQRNAINDKVIESMLVAIEELRNDSTVRAIVLTGGEEFFSAGADVSTFAEFARLPDTSAKIKLASKGSRMCAEWESLSQVTIAAIEGGAVGGGLALALACDWRVMANDAWCYVPEVKLGLNYGWSALPRLVGLVGPARAKTMAILCQRHGADEMLRWGLVDRVAAKGEAIQAALALAEEVCAMPKLPVQIIKQSINDFSVALNAVASHRDAGDMLLCMQDEEGAAARLVALGALEEKKRT